MFIEIALKMYFASCQDMMEELSQLQYSLDETYQGDKILYNKLIEACRQNPACQLACFQPSNSLQGLINNLHSSVATFEDTEKSYQSNEVLLTDWHYHKYPEKPYYYS